MRKLSAWWVPKSLNADQKLQRCQSCDKILDFFSAIQIISSRARLVIMDKTWLYQYDLETRQQSMEWRYNAPPHPEISECKNPLEISRLNFLGSRRHPPNWLCSKGPKNHHGALLIFNGATEGHFQGKTPREIHQGGLVLARQCPCSPDTCNPEETGLPGLPMYWSPTLSSGSGPVGLPPVPWTEKQLNRRHFSSDAEIIAAVETWVDGQRSKFFFSIGLQKLEQRVKNCSKAHYPQLLHKRQILRIRYIQTDMPRMQ